jgi:hypothetical protein
MIAKPLSDLRRQWLGALALFLVLTGGTAYALAGSNTVFSDDIVDGEVKAPDVANNAVATDELQSDGVRSVDVRDDALTGGGLSAADLASDSVGTREVLDDSLTGADVSEGTLGQVPSALVAPFGGIGRSTSQDSCSPSGSTFVDCAFVTLDLPAASRVLVIAAVSTFWTGNDFSFSGTCRLTASAPGVPGGEYVASTMPIDEPAEAYATYSTTVVTAPVGPGPMDFGVQCNKTGGEHDVARIRSVQIAAVALGPG